MAIKHSSVGRPVVGGGRSGFKAPKGSARVARRNAQATTVMAQSKHLSKKR